VRARGHARAPVQVVVRAGGRAFPVPRVGAPRSHLPPLARASQVVLAADSERELNDWMKSIRTSRMCIADPDAAGLDEEARRLSAEAELDAARERKFDPEAEYVRVEKEYEATQDEQRRVDKDKEKAEKQLKELMARFKLRKALLHWRHRKLTLSFRSLVSVVFRARIDDARRGSDAATRRIETLDAEMGAAKAARQKAEVAKRTSDSMLAKELSLKKEGEAELRDVSWPFHAEPAPPIAATTPCIAPLRKESLLSGGRGRLPATSRPPPPPSGAGSETDHGGRGESRRRDGARGSAAGERGEGGARSEGEGRGDGAPSTLPPASPRPDRPPSTAPSQVLALMAQLQQITATTDKLQRQLKRRLPTNQ